MGGGVGWSAGVGGVDVGAGLGIGGDGQDGLVHRQGAVDEAEAVVGGREGVDGGGDRVGPGRAGGGGRGGEARSEGRRGGGEGWAGGGAWLGGGEGGAGG